MAFLQPTRGGPDFGEGRVPFINAPAVVLWLLAAIIAAHLARVLLLPQSASTDFILHYGFSPAFYAPGVFEPGHPIALAIPFISYMFVHADATHLTINSLWLLAFGPVVARRFGPWRFLLFFAICGILSAAVYLIPMPQPVVVVIGASGAIAGLMAAGIRMIRLPTAEHPGLAPLFSNQVLVFSAAWIGVNLLFGLSGLSIDGDTHPIAWQGHLSGYAAGLFLSGLFDRFSAKSDADPALDA